MRVLFMRGFLQAAHVHQRPTSSVCVLVTAFAIGEAFACVESCSSDVVTLTPAVVYWCMTGRQGQRVVAGTQRRMKWSSTVRSSAMKPCQAPRVEHGRRCEEAG